MQTSQLPISDTHSTSASNAANISSDPSRQTKISIAVLGGGVAGVVAANALSETDGIDVTLLEQSTSLGGLHRSITIDGCNYDIGTFVFDTKHELFQSFPFLRQHFSVIPYTPQAIRKPGELDAYPLSVKGYIHEYGVFDLFIAGLDLLACRFIHRKRKTLPTYIKYYIGKRLYVRSGLKAYVERLYHASDTEIDILFAQQRLDILHKHLTFKDIATRAVARLRPTRNLHGEGLLSRPKEGFGVVYGMIHDHLLQQGVSIKTGASIQQIRPNTTEGGFDVLCNGVTQRFDRVISTIPIATVAAFLGVTIQANFEYMRLVSLFYRFKGNAGFSQAVLFNYSPDGTWKRITRFSSYYGPHNGDEYFVVEVTALQTDEEHVGRIRQEFETHSRSLGLFNGDLSFQGSHVTEHAYPLFRTQEVQKLQQARELVRSHGIDLLGRQGNFEYITSFATAMKSRAMAEQISSAL